MYATVTLLDLKKTHSFNWVNEYMTIARLKIPINWLIQPSKIYIPFKYRTFLYENKYQIPSSLRLVSTEIYMDIIFFFTQNFIEFPISFITSFETYIQDHYQVVLFLWPVEEGQVKWPHRIILLVFSPTLMSRSFMW